MSVRSRVTFRELVRDRLVGDGIDAALATAITDEVMVMDEGRIVETGRTAEVLTHPQSEAARALVDAAPDLHRAIAKRMQEQG